MTYKEAQRLKRQERRASERQARREEWVKTYFKRRGFSNVTGSYHKGDSTYLYGYISGVGVYVSNKARKFYFPGFGDSVPY